MTKKIIEFDKNNIEELKNGYNINKEYQYFQIISSLYGIKLYFNKIEYPIIIDNIPQTLQTTYIDSITLDEGQKLSENNKITITYYS